MDKIVKSISIIFTTSFIIISIMLINNVNFTEAKNLNLQSLEQKCYLKYLMDTKTWTCQAEEVNNQRCNDPDCTGCSEPVVN